MSEPMPKPMTDGELRAIENACEKGRYTYEATSRLIGEVCRPRTENKQLAEQVDYCCDKAKGKQQ